MNPVESAQPAAQPASGLPPPTAEPYEALKPMAMPRYPTLDGWRGISILLVMAGHILPLRAAHINGNWIVAEFGMAIFFILSGFLITNTLLYRPVVSEFLIRRLCRIVPLAWVFALGVLIATRASPQSFAAVLLFYANVPPYHLVDADAHLWSLCLEVQFYLAIALVVLLFRRRGLWLIPILCIGVTLYRIATRTYDTIETLGRADEILAGGTLALLSGVSWARSFRGLLSRVSPLWIAPLAILCCHPRFGVNNYARPYLVALMVGVTLFNPAKAFTSRVLASKALAYLAAISYALYIFHPLVGIGWLGSGSKLVKYAKRIPEMAAVFGLAHVSSFHFEAYWIRMGKKWSKAHRAAAG